MHPPVLLLVKTQREAPYQFPGRRRVVAPRACTESLIDATRNQHAPLIKSTARDEPALLYIWGHTYEMDAEYISWEKFDSVCKKLSGHSDIFYGTNGEVFGLC